MQRITQEQVEELIYMMGVHKRAIMDKLAFNSEDELRMIKQKDFKFIKDEIIEWKQLYRG